MVARFEVPTEVLKNLSLLGCYVVLTGLGPSAPEDGDTMPLKRTANYLPVDTAQCLGNVNR
jgi:hypothetical protein